MQEILNEFCLKKIIIYQDDILIMSKDFNEHLDLVERILNTLMVNGIKIQVAKCQFFKQEVTFLGHIISNKGIKKSQEFINKIENYPKPENVTQLRQFLGLANFQRKFINNFSTIARPLSVLTGGAKRKKLNWTKDMEESFLKLRKELTEELSLAFPDYGEGAEKLELYVDASLVGAGACLMQRQNNEHRPIAYSSVAFSKTEQNYAPIERELLAIRWGVKNFKAFLFGSPFIIYIDHRPLLYLYNMSRENAKLMRIISELEDFNYSLQYRPGPKNQAADTMSRIIKQCNQEDNFEKNVNIELPNGLRVIEKIEGGGNSLFEALYIVLDEIKEEINVETPADHGELRRILMDELLENPEKYKIKIDRTTRKMLKAMKNDGILPREESLLAACEIYNIIIKVHHGMPLPIIYKSNDSNERTQTVHLQCLANIHFNPVICKRNQYKEEVMETKNINTIVIKNDEDENNTEDLSIMQQFNVQIQEYEQNRHCNHEVSQFCSYLYSVGDVKFCALIDTGAEISIISEKVWLEIKKRNKHLELEKCEKELLRGIGGELTEVVGIVKLKLEILEMPLNNEIPFAVVENNKLPFCGILGANFLKANNVIIDFQKNMMHCQNDDGEEIFYPLKPRWDKHGNQVNSNSDNKFIGLMETKLSEDQSDENSLENPESEDENNIKVKFRINDDNFLAIQRSDHAITKLKMKITNKIDQKLWSEKPLHQYRRYHNQLRISNGILFRKTSNFESIVLPFLLIVQIIHKTHAELAHIGKMKLLDIIQKQFWHPALEKIITDICKSCPHCQIYKVSNQNVSAPIKKIETSYPFQLVSIDLMALETTKKKNVAVVVAIDHFSKWISVTPIKDKRAVTVTKVLTERILTTIPKLPERILSDNGPEFRSEEFNDALKKYDIQHVYSTPHKASSNGCVERSNRTIIQLLKGVADKNQDWDDLMPKVVIVHNNTKHSTIGKSPSDLIMKESHEYENKLPVSKELVSNWKGGHPKFCPYVVGQKVLKKIQRIGNRLKYKLQPRYDGPYEIMKSHQNLVTYEIKRMGYPKSKIINVHYNQIKAYIEIPDYLKNVIQFESITYREKIENYDQGQDYFIPPCFSIYSSNDTNSSENSDASQSDEAEDKKIKSNSRDQVNKNQTELINLKTNESKTEGCTNLESKKNKSKRVRKTHKNIADIRKLNEAFSIPLKDLHCTEMIDIPDKINAWTSTPVKDKIIETNFSQRSLSTINRAESLPELRLILDESHEKFNRSEQMRIPNKTITNDNAQEIKLLEEFILEMERAWTFTQSIIETQINEISTNVAKENTDINESNRKKSNESEKFLGFDAIETEDYKNQAEKLNEFRILNECAIESLNRTKSIRIGNTKFMRDLYRSGLLNSNTRTRHQTLEDEATADTPRMLLNFDENTLSNPRRITRSMGTVSKYPNVQKRILEYK